MALTLHMAINWNADYVIIDEKMARNLAEYLGFSVIGTLGILLKAKHCIHFQNAQNVCKSRAFITIKNY